jgi:hypothetical protein
MKNYLSIVLILLLLFSSLAAKQTENVFIVVIDGARYTETFGDSTHQYIPKIWNELRPLGTIYTSVYIFGKTSTNQAHASIATGTWQFITNDGSQRPNKPTLFEYYRKQINTSESNNYVILGKTKLNILSYSTHAEYGNTYNASVKTSAFPYDDKTTLDNIKGIVNAHHPKLVIINFAETDSKGHSGVWNNYLAAIKNVDNFIYELWNFIQSDSIYKDKTTMFVTNDHGRHTNNFKSHGDNCEGCRHIMLLAIGPDTPSGMVDSSARKQIDIAPTVGHLLNFDTPYSIGNMINTAIISHVNNQNINDNNFVKDFHLLQNYPNPFNASTTIAYVLNASGNVQLEIYNASGHFIRSLNNDYQSAGNYHVIWDGRDENGKPVASGLYFYTLNISENKSVSKCMLIVK